MTKVLLAENDEESRPEEFHPRPLAERSVKLSLHSAPIRAASSYTGGSVCCTQVVFMSGSWLVSELEIDKTVRVSEAELLVLEIYLGRQLDALFGVPAHPAMALSRPRGR